MFWNDFFAFFYDFLGCVTEKTATWTPLSIGARRVVFGRVVGTLRFHLTTRPKLGQLGHNSPYTRHNSATTRPQLAHFYRQKHTGMGGDVVRLHTCNVGTTHDLKKNNQG